MTVCAFVFVPAISAFAFDYRDIPGVTVEETAAVERLKNERDRFIYGAANTTEAFVNEDGTVCGFACEFAELLGKMFGIPFELRVLSFAEQMDGLRSGEVDFTGDLTKTPSREREFFMTEEIAERVVKSFRLKSSLPLEDVARLRPLRLGFLGGTVTESQVRQVLRQPFETSYAATRDEILHLLVNGEVDAFLVDAPAEASLTLQPDIKLEPFYPVVRSYVSLSTAQEELKPVIDVLQKFLRTDDARVLADIYNQGDLEYRRHKLRGELTNDERAYIKGFADSGRFIPVLLENDNYPVSFYNEREGEWQGIAPDVLKHMEDLLGVHFAPVNGSASDWTDLIYMLERGEGLMVSELMRTPEREERFAWADEPYSHSIHALISRRDFRNVMQNEVRFMRVGTIVDAGYESIFREWFPAYEEVRLFKTPGEAFDALDEGEVDLLMASDNMLLYAINYLERPDFKLNVVLDRRGKNFFGFNKDAAKLRSIINKAQEATDVEYISNGWKHRAFDYERSAIKQGLPILIGFTVVLLLALVLALFLFIKNWKMKRNLAGLVEERTSELQVQKEAAQAASIAKSEFLARMSHEMRTPLNAIMGMTDIALRSKDMERRDYCAEMVRDASQHMLGMINDILDMSRMESNKTTVVNTDFEVRSLMYRIEGMAYYVAERRSQKIRTDIADAVPEWVSGDSSHITQVIMNLLSNAVKFSPDGGQITLAIDVASETLPAVGEKFLMKISVEDEGIGISEESQKKIFQSFEQLDGGMTRRYGGMGLGLTISRRLVEVMGGELWVESECNKGSKFIFTVPVTRTLPDNKMHTAGETDRFSDAVTVERAARALGHRCILIAEDLEINRDIASAFFEGLDIMIDFAENGKIAVEKFKANEDAYDLILMDIQMPEMNGIDACKAIRALGTERAKDVPIIAMTANVFKEDVDKCLAAGMNDHIGKPVDRILLLRKVAEHIATRDSSRKNN